MFRFLAPMVVLSGVTALVACSGRDPVVDNSVVGNTAAPDIDVLPPDESATTATNQLEEGDAAPVNSVSANAAPGKIPAALQGRWGMTPGDCTSTRGDAKGLLIVASDGLRFYEAQAKPAQDVETSASSVSGDFAFTGEGMTWKKYQALTLQDGKLVRTESSPMTSYTYARCTS